MRQYSKCELDAAIADAVLKERERCARLCEEVADDCIRAAKEEGESVNMAAAILCAEEIRQS